MNKHIKTLFLTLLCIVALTGANAFEIKEFTELSDEQKITVCQDNVKNKKDIEINNICQTFLLASQKYSGTTISEDVIKLQWTLKVLKEIVPQDITGHTIGKMVNLYTYSKNLFNSKQDFINWAEKNLNDSTKIRTLLLENKYLDRAALHYLYAISSQDAEPEQKFTILQKRAGDLADIVAKSDLARVNADAVKYYYENGDIFNFLTKEKAKEYAADLFKISVYAEMNSKYKSSEKADKKAKELLLTPFEAQKKYVYNLLNMSRFEGIPPFENPSNIADLNNNFEATSHQTQTILDDLKKYVKAELKDTKTNNRILSFYASDNYKAFNDKPFSWKATGDTPELLLWSDDTKKIHVSIKILNEWLKDNQVSVKEVIGAKTNMTKLAKCLTPLFVHETEHQMYAGYFFGRDWDRFYSREEEVVAYNSQEVFMLEKERLNGKNYYADCPTLQVFREKPIVEYVNKTYANAAEPLTVANAKDFLEKYVGKPSNKTLEDLLNPNNRGLVSSWYGLSYETLRGIVNGTNASFNFYRAYMDNALAQSEKLIKELKSGNIGASNDTKKQQIRDAVKDLKAVKK